MSLACVLGCGRAEPPAAHGGDVDWPRITSNVAVDPALEERVESILSQMTLEQKVGQMIQAEIHNVTLSDVRQYHLGSILSGPGSYPSRSKASSVTDWLALADAFYDASMDTSQGGAANHRSLARQAVRQALVLLKNAEGLLPLPRNLSVVVAGDGADHISKQSGGWSVTWQGTENTNEDFPGATSIFAGIREAVTAGGGSATLSVDGSFDERPDVAIVVFGEEPYAESEGNLQSLNFSAEHGESLELLRRLKRQGIPVVSVFLSGRPLWVSPELNASTAFVAAWLPGTEGGGIADVLFRDSQDQVNFDFSGKLSYSWPRDPSQTDLNRGDPNYEPLFPYGFGLTYGVVDTLSGDPPEFHSSRSTTELPATPALPLE
jgi:hypothetical protein